MEKVRGVTVDPICLCGLPEDNINFTSFQYFPVKCKVHKFRVRRLHGDKEIASTISVSIIRVIYAYEVPSVKGGSTTEYNCSTGCVEEPYSFSSLYILRDIQLADVLPGSLACQTPTVAASVLLNPVDSWHWRYYKVPQLLHEMPQSPNST